LNCEVRVLPPDFVDCLDKGFGDAKTPFASTFSGLLELVDHLQSGDKIVGQLPSKKLPPSSVPE
jgi:hypothetical protein